MRCFKCELRRKWERKVALPDVSRVLAWIETYMHQQSVCTIRGFRKAVRKMPSRDHSTHGIVAGNVSFYDVRERVCTVNPDPAIAPGVDVKRRSRKAVAARVGNRSMPPGRATCAGAQSRPGVAVYVLSAPHADRGWARRATGRRNGDTSPTGAWNT